MLFPLCIVLRIVNLGILHALPRNDISCPAESSAISSEEISVSYVRLAVGNHRSPRSTLIADNQQHPGRSSVVALRIPDIAPWRARLTGSGFAANVAFMVTGTALGQAISVAFAPVLTRLYSPEQFGYLSVYMTLLMIVVVVAALGLELAIPIAASDSELANLLAASGVAVAGTTCLLALVVALIPDSVLAFLSPGRLETYRYLLPLGFACLGGYYVMVAVATRAGAFRDIAATRVSQGISGPVSQIVFAVFGAGTAGLALGYVIGQSSGTFLLFSRQVLHAPALRSAISWRGMQAVVRRYAGFPLLATWGRLLEAGSGTILFLLFAACYSSEVAGFMFLTERVVGRPLLIVSTSLLQVFTGEAGRTVQHNPGKLQERFWQVVPRQFLICIAWVVVVNVAAIWVFPLAFGEQWTAAIPYLHAMSATYLAMAVLHPVSTSLQILERQLLATLWQTFRLVLIVASVLLPWHFGVPALPTLWLASLAQVVSCGGMLVLIAISVRRLQPA